MRSEVLGLMFLLRELGTFFVTRTDDSKTQVPSFCQKKGPKSPKFFQLGNFFLRTDNALKLDRKTMSEHRCVIYQSNQKGLL